MRTCVSLLFAVVLFCPASLAQKPFPQNAKRILFLGDSITHAGHYICLIDAHLRLASKSQRPELINLGLPSETCSGLSEPIHPFPRPDVHERLDRALAKLKPDVVVACYGMNDGIYHPFSKERFAAYKRGIDEIISKVKATESKLILMTPPAFDALPLKKKNKLKPLGADEYSWKTIYEDYDDVMNKYAQYVLGKRDEVDMVIDLHGPVSDYVSGKRKSDPGFSMSPDGVHVNAEGHKVLAAAILQAWGLEVVQIDAELLSLVSKQQNVMHQAWLSEVGHKRPGVKEGLPIDQAQAKAEEIEKSILSKQ